VKHDHAFIFDLDGTLVDSLRDIADALNDALAELNQPRASLDEVRRWIGDGLTTLCRRASPTMDPDALHRLVELARTHYQEHCADHTRPYRNILQMLDLLTARGAPLAVLSNKPHALTKEVLQRLDMMRYFAVARGCDAEEERKPSPNAALEIAARLGVEPAAVFFVGDSPVDVLTARNAGMIAVAVTWGFRDRQELCAARPDYVADNPLEIPSLPEMLLRRR
jgi:phosphoglycolate phosphatase